MNIKTALAAVALVPLLGASALAQETPGALEHDQLYNDKEVYGHEAPTQRAQKPEAKRRAQSPAQEPKSAEGAANASAAGEDAAEPAWKRSAVRESEAAWRLSAHAVRLDGLSPEQVKELQKKLKEQGYYDAEVDGIPGRQTRYALRQFYATQMRLAVSGHIMPEAAQTLGLDSEEVQRVSGEEEPQRQTLRGTGRTATPRATTPAGPAPASEDAPRSEQTPVREPTRSRPDDQTPPEE